MKKKNPLLKLSACAAIIGGTIAFGQYIYKVSSKPHEHNGANDFDPLITRGREFIRNHPDRSDVLIESFDELMLHASFIPSKENSTFNTSPLMMPVLSSPVFPTMTK